MNKGQEKFKELALCRLCKKKTHMTISAFVIPTSFHNLLADGIVWLWKGGWMKQYSFEKELDRRFDSDPEFAVLYWRKRKSEIFRHKKNRSDKT